MTPGDDIQCRWCDKDLPRESFRPSEIRRHDEELTARCTPCLRVYEKQKLYKRLESPEARERYLRAKRRREIAKIRRKQAEDPEYLRWNLRRIKYGVTREVWNAMLKRQHGTCAISGCDREPAVIDHDHACCPGEKSCGKCVRALLCHRCNQGLGRFQDSPALLRSAADYLESFLVRGGQ
jgi:hypothetical protein